MSGAWLERSQHSDLPDRQIGVQQCQGKALTFGVIFNALQNERASMQSCGGPHLF
jgi:hypothetical protein